MGSQDENQYLFDTFKLNDDCHLHSARLAVGNGIYYPEVEYSYDNIGRIFIAVNNNVYNKMIKIQNHS